jgi:hypothetical protein
VHPVLQRVAAAPRRYAFLHGSFPPARIASDVRGRSRTVVHARRAPIAHRPVGQSTVSRLRNGVVSIAI